jgi:hypothetical protein
MVRFPIFDMFTNQTAGWEKRVPGTDRRGEHVYELKLDIKARITEGTKIVGDLAGIGEHADLSLMVVEQVSVGDRITWNGIPYLVTRYVEIPWLGGEYIGRFVFADREAPNG